MSALPAASRSPDTARHVTSAVNLHVNLAVVVIVIMVAVVIRIVKVDVIIMIIMVQSSK